jgi:hypothetical protein
MLEKLHKSWPGGHVYMLVAVDKFTKWIEAAPITTQDFTAAINFINNIPLWGTTKHHYRQSDKLYIQGIQKLLQKHGHQA